MNVLIALTLCLSLVGTAFIPGTPAIAQDTGSVSEHVYGANGTTPISGAELRVLIHERPGSSTYVTTVSSKTDGSYIVLDLPSDSYTISASATGFIREDYNGVYARSLATPIMVNTS